MSDPVIMDKADLAQVTKERDQAVENQVRMAKEIKVLHAERAQALDASNRSKTELERFRKTLPTDQVQNELRGMRISMGEAHKRISVLEKELVVAKAESEARRKETAKVASRFDGVQGTLDTMQVARDKACADRAQALAQVEQAAAAYHKLQGEFEEFKKASAEAKGKPQQEVKK
jgi:chromosome segregation ATPase